MELLTSLLSLNSTIIWLRCNRVYWIHRLALNNIGVIRTAINK